MTIRIINISDTHLSATHGLFYPNFLKVVDRINAEAPNLVINTGDIAVNGPDSDADMAFAAREHQRLNAPLLTLPGNHDIGEEPPGQPAKQYINAERRARWHKYFGPDYWAMNVGAWRLIGINSQLMGSGIEAEEPQWEWLATELAQAQGRPVGIFQHKPPYREDPDTPHDGFRCMTAAARARYAALIEPSTVRFLSCGHSHVHKKDRWLDRDIYWVPPTSAHEDGNTGLNAYCGYLDWRFDGEDYRVDVVFPLELERIDFNDMKAGKYERTVDMPVDPPVTAD
ncbi:MAG: metallophosphoesterase [Pseudomonadota bacterium]